MAVPSHPALELQTTVSAGSLGHLYARGPGVLAVLPLGNNIVLGIGSSTRTQPQVDGLYHYGVCTWRVDPLTFAVTVVDRVELATSTVQMDLLNEWIDFDRKQYAWVDTDASGNSLWYGRITWDEDGHFTVDASTITTTTGATLVGTEMFAALDDDWDTVTILRWGSDTTTTSTNRGQWQQLGFSLHAPSPGTWSAPSDAATTVLYPQADAQFGSAERGVDTLIMNVTGTDIPAFVVVASLSGGEVTWADTGVRTEGYDQTARGPTVFNGVRWTVFPLIALDVINNGLNTPSLHRVGGHLRGADNYFYATSPPTYEAGGFTMPSWAPEFAVTEPLYSQVVPYSGRVEFWHSSTQLVVEASEDLNTLARLFPMPPLATTSEQRRVRADRRGNVRISFTRISGNAQIRVYGLDQARCILDVDDRVLAVPYADGNDWVIQCVLEGDVAVAQSFLCDIDVGSRVIAVPIQGGSDYAVYCADGTIPLTGDRILAVPIADGSDIALVT